MTIFKTILSRITDLQSHRIFFILAWIASYGLAWHTVSVIELFFNYAHHPISFWFRNNALWVRAVLIGFSFGLILSLVQTWLIRQRYGFVPLLWRSVTIFGATLAGLSFPFYNYLLGTHQQWLSFFIWFSFLNSVQAVVLFRVNRRAWLFALVGIIAGVVASSISAIDPLDVYWSLNEDWALMVGSVIQAIGTSIVIMYLMANPRQGIVPKREPDELNQAPLTPLRFIALWTLPYFIAWALFSIVWVWNALVTTPITGFAILIIIRIDWFHHSPWQVGLMIGLTIGITSAIIHTRLIKRFSKFKIYQWALVTIVGWIFAGIAFGYYGQSYIESDNIVSLKNILLLTIWFTAPAFFQTLSIWLVIRNGWLWILTGIGSTIVGIIIDSQVSWWTSRISHEINDINYISSPVVAHDLSYFYVVVLGGLAYGVITGSVFVLLQSQQGRTESQLLQEV